MVRFNYFYMGPPQTSGSDLQPETPIDPGVLDMFPAVNLAKGPNNKVINAGPRKVWKNDNKLLHFPPQKKH